jgi:hypothetical protein
VYLQVISSDTGTLFRHLAVSVLLTPEIYSERIKKNEVSRNKKLTHCINMATSENAPNWAK